MKDDSSIEEASSGSDGSDSSSTQTDDDNDDDDDSEGKTSYSPEALSLIHQSCRDAV